MDPRQLFYEDHDIGICVYCGALSETRDHVPSKVLLDVPYSSELPVVGACKKCNASFSLDEQYIACFLDCMICGDTEISDKHRPKVKRILTDNLALKCMIDASKTIGEEGILLWEPENDRVLNVMMKLARGHAAYELYPQFGEPSEVDFAPVQSLSSETRLVFELNSNAVKLDLWPEIGTRAFFRASGKSPDSLPIINGWIVVQPGRYRYSVEEIGGICVRMVLSEYLACEVTWKF